MTGIRAALLALTFVSFFSAAIAADQAGPVQGPVAARAFPVTDGPVYAIAQQGETVYIGGSFSRVSRPTGAGVPVDPLTGEPQRGFPMILGRVYEAISDGAGGWFIGGDFETVGGLPRGNLAHIRGDGTVSEWDPGPNGYVSSLARRGTTLYVAGSFTMIGGQERFLAAAVDTGSGHPTSWDPSPSNEINVDRISVNALAVRGDSVYVGGLFTNIGGERRATLAELDGTTGEATDWDPGADYRCCRGVTDIAVEGNIVYVAGRFASMGHRDRDGLAAIYAQSGWATEWNPSVDWRFNQLTSDLVVRGGTVYIAGFFTSIGGEERPGLAALDGTTGEVTPWEPAAAPDRPVHELAVTASTVYLGGLFETIGGAERNHLAALDGRTGELTDWNPHPFDYVQTIALDEHAVFVGGDFSSMGGVPRANLAAVDRRTGRLTDWAPDTDNVVIALADAGPTLYVGGNFTTIADQERNGLAAVDSTSGQVSDWDPGAELITEETLAGRVFSLAVDGSTVYAGGWFTSIGGQPRNNLAALDRENGQASDWDPDADDFVITLALDGSTLYAGGFFQRIGGKARSHVAALDTETGDATSWAPDAGGHVYSVALSGSTVFAGGRFETIGGKDRRYLAAIDAASGKATDWDAGVEGVQVYDVAVAGPSLLVGGRFNEIGGYAAGRDLNLAIVDVTTGEALPWDPGIVSGGQVWTIALDRTPAAVDVDRVGATGAAPHATRTPPMFYIGGWFESVSDEPRPHFAAMGPGEASPGDVIDLQENLPVARQPAMPETPRSGDEGGGAPELRTSRPPFTEEPDHDER